MATLTRVTLTEVGASFSGGVGGQAAGYQAAAGGGDKVPIGSGRGTIIRFRTTGTGSTITLDSTRLSGYGGDQNIVLTLAGTDEQEIFIANDGSNRFDAGGADAGLVNISYSSVVGLTLAAKTVP